MIRYYETEIAGMPRRLPLYLVDEDLCEALFTPFNDVALTAHAAMELLKLVPAFDVILTEEVQGIPLAYEMSRQAGLDRYVVARKGAKAHMDDVVAIQIEDPTDNGDFKKLYLTSEDAAYLENKRILIVDDVVLHGSTLHSLKELGNAMGGYVVGMATILMREDASVMPEMVSLGVLPLFHADGSLVGSD